jgi:hypothetical protein
MERKKEMFFDGDEVNMQKVITHLQQYSNYTESILNFVMDTLVHCTEFRMKKEFLKERYEHKLQKLYAEYMKEDEE